MFATEPVTFLAPTPKADRYSGQSSDDWSSPTTVLEVGALVAPGGSIEPVAEGANRVEADFDLIVQSEVEVSRLWRVVVRGELCQIVGKPHLWRWPSSGVAGVIVQAKEIHG